MSSTLKFAGTCLLTAALLVLFAPSAAAKGPGGGHGGGGFGGGHAGGHAGGGFRGGHVGGGWGGGGAIHGPSGHLGVQPFAGGHAANRNWTEHGGSWGGRTWLGDHWGWGGHFEPDWDDWWWFGLGLPWLGLGSWWPGYYGYYDYYPNYGYGYYGDPYAGAYAPGNTVTPAPPEAASAAGDFYAQALAAFKQGDYGAAVNLARHAAIDNPRDPDVHLLLMLAASGMGDYRGAAMEAHAVAALGPVPDWPTLFGFYGNLQPYTDQRHGLEKFVGSNPSAPEGHFLLGFEYLMEGHRDAARPELLQALKLAPRDQLAANLLKEAGGTVPADVARQLSGKGTEPEKAKAPSPQGSPPAVPPSPPKPVTEAGP